MVPFEELSANCDGNGIPTREITVGVVRGVKRRNTANKKERRRTQSINAAFQDLRDRIPNVPADTKLSKVSSHNTFLQGRQVEGGREKFPGSTLARGSESINFPGL